MSRNSHQISYSILDLALISESSTTSETLHQSLELAQTAEKFGYTRFWLAEHHNFINIASVATSVLIGHIASGTSKIRVGSGGIMLPNHSPLIVAEQFGTLGQLYPGRIDLGLGRAPGTDQKTAHAIRSDRMKSVHNFPNEVAQIQRYFSRKNEGSDVRAFIAEGIELPVFILGSSTDSAYLAAELGLPYAFASHFAPTHFKKASEIYRNNFQASEQLDQPYLLAGINVILGETSEKAARMYTSLLRMALGIFTGKREYLQPPTEMNYDLRRIAEHPAIKQMLEYSMIGNREEVFDQTKIFLEENDVDEIIAVTNVFNHNDRLHSYKEFAGVINELNEKEILSQN